MEESLQFKIIMKKTTLITGAGRGIGLEIAKYFASKNENLILLIRKKKQIKEINKIKKSEKKLN